MAKEHDNALLANFFNVNHYSLIENPLEHSRLVINRTQEKVQELLSQEEVKLWQRREKLKQLLENEEEALIQELATKQEMEECGYCKEKEKKQKGYLEEIEKEKIIECQKALEREKM